MNVNRDNARRWWEGGEKTLLDSLLERLRRAGLSGRFHNLFLSFPPPGFADDTLIKS